MVLLYTKKIIILGAYSDRKELVIPFCHLYSGLSLLTTDLACIFEYVSALEICLPKCQVLQLS